MSRYQFSSPAKQDLKEIAAYIRRGNPKAAKKLIERLREVCRTTLVMFPEGGSQREELALGLRCFSEGNYVIYFRGRSPVEIIRVLHGARDVKPSMFP